MLIDLTILDEGCSQRRCYGPSESGDVNCCSFHPTKPKLACGLDGGRVCLFSESSQSIPFAEWTKTILQAATNPWIKCIDWKVGRQNSSCAIFFKIKKNFVYSWTGANWLLEWSMGWWSFGTKMEPSHLN
jgi:hypothetical protein